MSADQSYRHFDRPAAPFSLPNPATVRTAAELRSAIAEILRHHDLGVVSTRMRVPMSTVRRMSRWPEQADQSEFKRFLNACGAGQAETTSWVAAWQAVRAGGSAEHPRPAAEPVADVHARRVSRLPDLSEAGSYGDLLCAMRTLRVAAAVSTTDIEMITGGRLNAHRAVAILDGRLAATGEELVLLLRACGLRDEIDQWIDAWQRLDGATLGRPRRRVSGVHRLRPVGNTGAGVLRHCRRLRF